MSQSHLNIFFLFILCKDENKKHMIAHVLFLSGKSQPSLPSGRLIPAEIIFDPVRCVIIDLFHQATDNFFFMGQLFLSAIDKLFVIIA